MSYNRQTQKIESKTLVNDGLVAGMYFDIGIGFVTDEAIEQDEEKRNVSIGQAVKAMVRGGLGFVNQRRHDFPKFFQDKPVDRLIGEDIEAEQLNEHVMGRALDDIFDYGATSLYSQIAVTAAQTLSLECLPSHLDSTSFHTDGTYDLRQDGTEKSTTENVSANQEESDTESNRVIHITKGYSRVSRPDLNQAILQLCLESSRDSGGSVSRWMVIVMIKQALGKQYKPILAN